MTKEEKSAYAKKEEEILEFWKKNKIFEKTLAKTKNKKPYVFYDGPPFATGLPHYGHILASAIKDLIPRYFTMKGRYVPRRWGWDCHGLPVEHLIEKKLAVNSRKEILEIGLARFNQKAKESVLEYANEWEKFVNRIGRFVDFKNSYKTMDADYMESVWRVFSELYKKGLVYKDSRISLFCPRCSTPLSNFEIAMADAYKDREDPSVYLKFKILPSPRLRQAGKNQKEYFLVWTTTPWTLPANVALALNPEAYYLTIEKNNEWLIISEEQIGLLGENPKIILRQKGEKLLGLKYDPLYKTIEQNIEKAYRTVGADFVDAKEGTGIVHIAPAFGEDDFNLAKKENLAAVLTLDEAGKFKTDFKELKFVEGKTFTEANDLIIKELESRNLIFKKEKIIHSYPFCWRCETPLIYMLQPAWFLNIKKIKKKLLELNEKIDWHPKHLKKGRFGKGIETAPDWNVSRSRFWGAPLPVWTCEECKNYIVAGSLEDLDKYSPDKSKKHNWPYNKEGEVDLHRPFIDEIKLKCQCGGQAERIPDVFDCWFESGSMPYAQANWPFARAKIKSFPFPADFVAEGLDQTRGWFYTLHVLAGALFEKPAFKHVITSGIILSEKGEKLSKSKKNFPDPGLVFDKYGVDSLRYYLMTSPVMQSENINFSEKDVKEVHQKLILTLLNVLNYHKLYKKPKAGKKILPALNQMDVLDKWILSRLNNLIQNTTKEMDD
ncbi:MAG: isoleucine--tRNA ligase, partial [Patescibacteria group bacterium]